MALIFLIAASAAAQPATVNNNDSCDIGVTPAATLLLPYFEVDTLAAANAGSNTLFTVTNASPNPQIAHVTIWTDSAFPVLNFNIFLTGYDVQTINLFDVIVRGVVVPAGTSIDRPPPRSGQPGAAPLANTANPNILAPTTCTDQPGVLPAELVAAVRNALTVGQPYNVGLVSCDAPVGMNHGRLAIGYATIDVVSYCSRQTPADPDGTYFLGPSAAILFDNVLIGDYQQIAPSAVPDARRPFDAQGGPMVHIRAVPEGGLSGVAGGTAVPTNLPFTFYDRYTPARARTADRRQPLPSAFAARFLQTPKAELTTTFKIWREGVTGPAAGCATLADREIHFTAAVRFDEHENSFGFGGFCFDPIFCPAFALPATSRHETTSSLFPSLGTDDVGGWIYLNLSSGSQHGAFQPTCDATLSAQRAGYALTRCTTADPGASGSRSTSQNWVVVSFFGQIGGSRMSVDFDATTLANGCTPEAAALATIGPAVHP